VAGGEREQDGALAPRLGHHDGRRLGEQDQDKPDPRDGQEPAPAGQGLRWA
jgi:hypothetical protein